MPYVTGYFRRSAGSVAAAGPAPKRLDVAIYNASTGDDLLRGWPRDAISNLRFSTAIPGGFNDAEFVILEKTPSLDRIRSGQKVIIRNGHQIVWWGWVEDLQWTLKGDVQGLKVLCMGPYQQASQRVMDRSVSMLDGDEAVKATLMLCCDRISWDFSRIEATGVSMGDQSGEFVKAANMIAAACATGNTNLQPMLFAVWEPGKNLEATSISNLALTPGFEDNTDWSFSAYAGRSSSYTAYSGSYVAYGLYGNGTRTATSSAYMTVTAGVPVLFSAYYRISVDDPDHQWTPTFKILWYDSGSSLVATTTYSESTDFVTATSSWQLFTQIATPPATAVKCKIILSATVSAVLGSKPDFLWDDVLMYVYTSGTERKPLPWLWARDLSTYDYLLYTKRVGINLTETTRALANAVWAIYGENSLTAVAEDATSQAAYRQRDAQIDASDMDATAAAAYRDVYLARYKDPLTEPASFTVQRGAILKTHGAPVDLSLIRAGDRLKVMDGPFAGRIFLLMRTNWSEDGLQCTPEAGDDAPVLLAKAAKAETPKWKPWAIIY